MRLLCLLVMLLLAGCGQKGPLYFAPEQPPGTEQASPTTAAPSSNTDDDHPQHSDGN